MLKIKFNSQRRDIHTRAVLLPDYPPMMKAFKMAPGPVLRVWSMALFLSLSGTLFSQNSVEPEDISFINTFNSQEVRHKVLIQKTKGGHSVVEALLSGPYLFYKYFISSQDLASCSFHPSCANYARQAVARKGAWGILLGFERLTRCHGLDEHQYIRYRNGTWLNPVGE